MLPSAVSSLASFKIGDQITLLLTPDLQVAGAVESRSLSGNAIGVASISGKEATVVLPEGLTLKGSFDGDEQSVQGQLVSVSSWKEGALSLNVVQTRSNNDALDVAKKTLGSYALSADVQLFERVGKGPVASIALEDIRLAKIPATKVAYHRINDNGKVNLLILDNVTGNQYHYGISKTTYEKYEVSNPGGSGSDSYTLEKLRLKTPGGELGPYPGIGVGSENWVGIVVDGRNKVVASVKLKSLLNVTNAAWESEDLVLFGNKSYAVSDEVICYNSTTGRWVTLGEARAFGESMTLYVDDFDVVRAVQVSN